MAWINIDGKPIAQIEQLSGGGWIVWPMPIKNERYFEHRTRREAVAQAKLYAYQQMINEIEQGE
jgi:hypothetical protein